MRIALDRPCGRAFTVLELLTVMVVMGILATLLISAVKKPRAQVERVACMANMRSLHVGLNSYVTDHGQWPQMPPNLDNEQSANWWITVMRQYVGDEKVWTCPTFQREFAQSPEKFSEHPKIDYIPTDFDPLPMTPYKWSGMPWLVEVGDFHGAGNLAIFPDGSVRTIWEAMKQLNPGAPTP